MTQLESLRFKHGFLMTREQYTRYSIWCPVCEAHVETGYDYNAMYQYMKDHAERHGEIISKEPLLPNER